VSVQTELGSFFKPVSLGSGTIAASEAPVHVCKRGQYSDIPPSVATSAERTRVLPLICHFFVFAVSVSFAAIFCFIHPD
jgi:hypothetical protein